jgi:hypothetical protein
MPHYHEWINKCIISKEKRYYHNEPPPITITQKGKIFHSSSIVKRQYFKILNCWYLKFNFLKIGREKANSKLQPSYKNRNCFSVAYVTSYWLIVHKLSVDMASYDVLTKRQQCKLAINFFSWSASANFMKEMWRALDARKLVNNEKEIVKLDQKWRLTRP